MSNDTTHVEAGELIVLHKLLDRVPGELLDEVTAECMHTAEEFEDKDDPEYTAYLEAVAFVAAWIYRQEHPKKFAGNK